MRPVHSAVWPSSLPRRSAYWVGRIRCPCLLGAEVFRGSIVRQDLWTCLCAVSGGRNRRREPPRRDSAADRFVLDRSMDTRWNLCCRGRPIHAARAISSQILNRRPRTLTAQQGSTTGAFDEDSELAIQGVEHGATRRGSRTRRMQRVRPRSYASAGLDGALKRIRSFISDGMHSRFMPIGWIA